MELHILEHILKVASIEKEGIQVCTHGLIKLAFLASKTRYVTSKTRREKNTHTHARAHTHGVIKVGGRRRPRAREAGSCILQLRV